MERLEMGPVENGKTRSHRGDEVKSVAMEYSPAKPNLCPTTDVIIEVPHNQEESKTPEELYQALSDKNHAIELLKRRLTNQQIQLGYYLHKNLATEAVLEFSDKCIPQLAEDSTQLSLAMYKFIRDSGGKTRLAQLREKLTDYNNRVHKVLLRQEQLIRQGYGFNEGADIRRNEVAIIVEDKNYAEGQSDDMRFAKKYYKSAKLEMCSQLLSVTLQVRKELEQFRICAENVVRLEEERNALVDQMFSLPVEQRYGNLRIAMVDNLRKRDSVTSVPSKTSVSTNTTAEVEGKDKEVFNNLGGVLHDMESEAIELLLLSEKQKNEFVIALEEARLENQHLKERLRDLEEVASDERVIDLQKKCVSIEKEVEGMRKDLEAEQNEKIEIIKQMAIELEKRDANEKATKTEMKKLKATIDLLRNERDNLQKKLEATTRQHIRQMHRNTSTDDIMNNKSEVANQQDVEDLTDLVVLQEEQIKDLLSIMSGMSDNDNDTVSSLSTIEKKSGIPFRSSKQKVFDETKLEFFDSGIDAHPCDTTSSRTTSHRKEEVAMNNNEPIEQQEEYQIYYDSTSEFSNQDMSEDERMDSEPPADCESKISNDQEEPKSKSNYGNHEAKVERPRTRSLTRRKFFSDRISRHEIMKDSRRNNRNDVATTSLTVQAFDKDGKSESMHAVLECSSPVDGLLEMNNSSKLHLRLQCTSPQRHSEYPDSRETSNYTTTDKDIPGDHRSPDVISYSENRYLSRDARMYLSKQLNRIKSRLQNSRSNSIVRKEIVQNLNEIYSQLFGVDDDILTQSSQS